MRYARRSETWPASRDGACNDTGAKRGSTAVRTKSPVVTVTLVATAMLATRSVRETGSV